MSNLARLLISLDLLIEVEPNWELVDLRDPQFLSVASASKFERCWLVAPYHMSFRSPKCKMCGSADEALTELAKMWYTCALPKLK